MELAWHRLTRGGWFLLLGSLAFVLIGLAMVIAPRGGRDTVPGYMVVAFGAACLAAGMIPLFSRPPRNQIALGTLWSSGLPVQGFVFAPALVKFRLVVFGLLAAAIASFVFLLVEPGLVAALAFLLFGGLLAFTAPAALGVRGAVQFALTREGVHVGSPLGNARLIPWEAIDHVYPISIRGTELLMAKLRDPSKLKMSWFGRLLMKVNRSWFGAETSLTASALAVSPRVQHAAVIYYLEFPDEIDSIGTTAGLDRLTAALATID
jgi:hypothetical protein